MRISQRCLSGLKWPLWSGRNSSWCFYYTSHQRRLTKALFPCETNCNTEWSHALWRADLSFRALSKLADLSLVLEDGQPLKGTRRGYLSLPLVKGKESCFVSVLKDLVEAVHLRDQGIHIFHQHTHTHTHASPMRTNVGRTHFFLSYSLIRYQK